MLGCPVSLISCRGDIHPASLNHLDVDILSPEVVLFPTYDAPKYKYGYQVLILFGGLAVAGMYLLDFLYKRDL